MDKFETFTGVVAAIDRPNIDTDAIIPKQYLKSIKRSGFGVNLFDDWRYLDPGAPGDDHSRRRPNPDFVLNQDAFAATSILLARENFGCGSSREHAVWALLDFGIRVVIAPSFADIFYNNSFKNGLLPIALETTQVDRLFAALGASDDYRLTIDLERQCVIDPEGVEATFEVDAFRRHCLLNGLDDIGLTMQYADEIRDFEQAYYARSPWLERAPS
ncbi:MAG: 3-isopropylmalate dehydratase small subunit [Gammaproteobacteria bacterium]|nr:3-isopropylmalate dehydratase small subunit [Gammaproteobacteria bacterium]